jgi:hypothetical protein
MILLYMCDNQDWNWIVTSYQKFSVFFSWRAFAIDLKAKNNVIYIHLNDENNLQFDKTLVLIAETIIFGVSFW